MLKGEGKTAAVGTRLPPELYASHVEALFGSVGTFMIGVAGSSSMLVVAGFASRQSTLEVIGGLVLAFGALRVWMMRRFASVRPGLDVAGLRRWEINYIVGGSASLALLGVAVFAAFGSGEDEFARLATIAVVMAYLVGTPGRSFASPLLVNVQIAVVSVPVLAGLALAGGWYLWIDVLVMLPFFVALKAISSRLNAIFVAAVTRASELRQLATRFDIAVTNMPQGLAMFGRDGKVGLVNPRLLEMLSIEPATWSVDADVGQLTAALGRIGDAEPLTKLLLDPHTPSPEVIATISGDRSLGLRLQRVNGGGVLLVEDVTARVGAAREILDLATFDTLTGLMNRRSFHAAVEERARSRDGASILLFVDLDRFKQVNDTLGHVVGDRLISVVADRLRVVSEQGDILGRLGGDEFVLYRSVSLGQAEAEVVAKTIIRRLSEPYDLDGQRVTIGASVGISVTRESEPDIHELLREADLALYRAKAKGRGVHRLFQRSMKVDAEARRRTEEDLRSALARDELEVFYQPIYDVRSGMAVTCEALVRWRHPTRGLVPPGEFISIAEEAGLIGRIGEWVLSQACADCASWPETVAVAVNFSVVQFQRGDVVSMIRRGLEETGLSPQRLEVEVTESLMLKDAADTATILNAITSLGVKLVLDDFGTGYSSLSYLQSLPFDKVKLDQSFLRGVDRGDRAALLLRNIQRMCSDMGMEVVMEGVETEEQMNLVVDVSRISLLQGYLLGRPVPVVEIKQRLEAERVGLAPWPLAGSGVMRKPRISV